MFAASDALIIPAILHALIFLFAKSGAVVNAESSDCNKESEIETVGKIDYRLNELDQDDPELVEIIRRDYLIPPSEEGYNFTATGADLHGIIIIDRCTPTLCDVQEY